MKVIHWLSRLRFNIIELCCMSILAGFLNTNSFGLAAIWFAGIIVFCPKAKDATS